MKTTEGHTWYKQDLNCYTSEFLIEIINDLVKDDD